MGCCGDSLVIGVPIKLIHPPPVAKGDALFARLPCALGKNLGGARKWGRLPLETQPVATVGLNL
jgi:hypothetical protein